MLFERNFVPKAGKIFFIGMEQFFHSIGAKSQL